MNIDNKEHAIVIGDYSNNTLGVIRSLGEAKASFFLLLVGADNGRFVTKSKYIQKNELYELGSYDDVPEILKQVSQRIEGCTLICTCDPAAEYIDGLESELSNILKTPMRGKSLSKLLRKSAQCALAQQYGVTVPSFVRYTNNDCIPCLKYPVLTKPERSNFGSKDDIHVCHNESELSACLLNSPTCRDFIIQSFIQKEYEVNFLGVANDCGVFITGGIVKKRHFPTVNSACSYGVFYPLAWHEDQGFCPDGVLRMIKEIGYKGVFSAEFLKEKEHYYFMEVNFRNDGLAYASTCAGANLVHLYISNCEPKTERIRQVHMMDLAADFNHVKEGRVSIVTWFVDFVRTKCHLYVSISDFRPMATFYLEKLWRKIKAL